MFKTKTLDTDHKDVIHDIAFDWYGTRMATCSTDQVVKIWNLSDGGTWELNATIKSLCGSVWKVTWAHPEFGHIIATCSFDRSASIYEETVADDGQGMAVTWKRCHTLVEARSAVMDVKFAPKALGLMLATCAADGLVRIYEAYDVMNLSQWTPTHAINTPLPSCSCLSWNPSLSRSSGSLLAVGSDDCHLTGGAPPATAPPATPRVVVYGQVEGGQWRKVAAPPDITAPVHDISFAANPGRSYHTLAVAAEDLRIITLKPKPGSEDQSLELKLAGRFGDFGATVWRVSWNVTGTVLTATGDSGAVRVYRANYLDVWRCVGSLNSSFSGETRDTDDVTQRPPLPAHPSHGNAKFFSYGPTNPAQVAWH